jgi:hypothetical protein
MAVPLVPEAKLFLAVFRQCAQDLRSGDARLEREARAWVLQHHGTFDWYAHLLGLDPGALRRAMLDGSRQRPGPRRVEKRPGLSPQAARPWGTTKESA